MTQKLAPKLFSAFHDLLYQNCEKLHSAKPWLDDEELEEMAYELTQKQFYYQALNFLNIENQKTGMVGWK